MFFLNEWMEALDKYRNSYIGDLAFLEYTVDENGMEIAAGTPKSSEFFEADWAIPSGTLPLSLMPKYISSWDQIYHPDLVERKRAG